MGLLGVFIAGLAWTGDSRYQRTVMLRETNTGETFFSAWCETCHGRNGNGSGGAPPLDDGAVMEQYPSFESLDHYIQTEMPATDPGILTPQEAQDLTHFIISLNH